MFPLKDNDRYYHHHSYATHLHADFKRASSVYVRE